MGDKMKKYNLLLFNILSILYMDICFKLLAFHNIFTIPKETSNSLACTSYFPSVLHASVTMNLLIVSIDLPCRFVEWADTFCVFT